MSIIIAIIMIITIVMAITIIAKLKVSFMIIILEVYFIILRVFLFNSF